MCEYPYDNSTAIPALRLDVKVENIATRESLPYRALIDTGSDLSRIPPKVFEVLKLPPSGTGDFGYGDGVATEEIIYRAFILWNAFRLLATVRVGPANRDYVLIGRDVLNQVIMHCNGPKKMFSFDEV